jgi:hypothetical protein
MAKGVLSYTCHMPVPIRYQAAERRLPVPLSHPHNSMDVVRLDLGRDRAQDQVLAQEQAILALQT